ncbi:MAG: hypothetical protein ACK2UU_12280, partial [Anaerolineae bacterium]
MSNRTRIAVLLRVGQQPFAGDVDHEMACWIASGQMQDRPFPHLAGHVACGISSTASGFTSALRSPGGSPR